MLQNLLKAFVAAVLFMGLSHSASAQEVVAPVVHGAPLPDDPAGAVLIRDLPTDPENFVLHADLGLQGGVRHFKGTGGGAGLTAAAWFAVHQNIGIVIRGRLEWSYPKSLLGGGGIQLGYRALADKFRVAAGIEYWNFRGMDNVERVSAIVASGRVDVKIVPVGKQGWNLAWFLELMAGYGWSRDGTVHGAVIGGDTGLGFTY